VHPCIWWRAYACGIDMEGVASGASQTGQVCREGVGVNSNLRGTADAGGLRAQEMRKTTRSTSDLWRACWTYGLHGLMDLWTSDLWRACWTYSAPVYALQSNETSCARVGVEGDEHAEADWEAPVCWLRAWLSSGVIAQARHSAVPRTYAPARPSRVGSRGAGGARPCLAARIRAYV